MAGMDATDGTVAESNLQAERAAQLPSVATINRVLSRHGAQDRALRIRHAPPPTWLVSACGG